jgi:predicted acylesterase/phospholipase RssA
MLHNKALTLYLLMMICFSGLASDENPEEYSYPKIGIALSGGGIRGMAHIGVLRRLEEEGIKIDMIAGSSMGAMIGGLYALGYDTYEIERLIKSSDTREIFSNRPERNYTENYLKKTADRTVVELEMTADGIKLPNAINNGHKAQKRLRQLILSSEYHDNDFDNLKYRLRVVCSDIQNGKKVVFREGDLPAVILGSMSFPGLFKPVTYKDMKLLDGGLTDNVPTGELEGCDIILASNMTHDTPQKDRDYNFIELLDRISLTMTRTNTERSLEKADVVFRPDLEDITMSGLENPDSLIQIGYIEADKKIEDLKKLIGAAKKPGDQNNLNIMNLIFAGNMIFSDEELLAGVSAGLSYDDVLISVKKRYRNAGYILSRAEMAHGEKDTVKISEGKLKKINIKGDHSTRKSFIRQEMSVRLNEPLRLKDIEESADNLFGTGLFDKVNYSIDLLKDEITISVDEKPYYLFRIGANYQTDRGFIGLFEGANKNLHGKRAEFYAGVIFGEKFNRAEASYYNPFMRRSTLFFEFQPYYQSKLREFYDTGHNKLNELSYDEIRYGAGFNLGFQIFDNYQASFGINQEYISFEDEFYNKNVFSFKILADSRDDHVIPSKGVFFLWNAETGIVDFDPDKRYQKVWWEFSVYKKLLKRFSVDLGVCGGTGDNLLPHFERFTTGGIKMMPGTYHDEYSAVQFFRIKSKQNILLFKGTLLDTYLTTGYYLNGFWGEPDIEWRYKDFSNSFHAGITLNTTLGPVEAGWGAVAGNGSIRKNNRYFLSVGYPIQ